MNFAKKNLNELMPNDGTPVSCINILRHSSSAEHHEKTKALLLHP